MKNSSISHVRIPLYQKKGVEVHVCVSNGKASLEISNTADLPRLISLANVFACPSEIPPTIINIGAHCLRKLPWSLRDYPRLKTIDVKVSDTVEDTLRLTRGIE